MKNYYEVLGVTPFSSISEIKHVFREKAKMLHPDLNVGIGETDRTEKMRELLEAYRAILENHKAFVDRNVFQSRRVKEFNYRQWLLEREDYESRAKLIVFDLFHEREKSGVEEYLRLLTLDMPFTFSKYFSREDFMDYGFVLAEELFFEKHYYEAFILIEEIFIMEEKKPYFTHFFPEVIRLAKNCLTGLKTTHDTAKIVECYKIACTLQFTKRQKEAFEKQIEKILARCG